MSDDGRDFAWVLGLIAACALVATLTLYRFGGMP